MAALRSAGRTGATAILAGLLLCAAAGAEPPAERLARHALGRADAAERLGLCLQDHARTLKGLAERLLAAEDAAKREVLRAELRAAHRALDECLPRRPPASRAAIPCRRPTSRRRRDPQPLPARCDCRWWRSIRAWPRPATATRAPAACAGR